MLRLLLMMILLRVKGSGRARSQRANGLFGWIGDVAERSLRLRGGARRSLREEWEENRFEQLLST